MQAHIYTNTCAYIHLHRGTHIYKCTDIQACPHIGCTHTQTCLYTEHMHLDTHLPRETHAYMSAQTHTCVYTLCQSFKQWIWRICSLSWVGQIPDGSRVMIITHGLMIQSHCYHFWVTWLVYFRPTPDILHPIHQPLYLFLPIPLFPFSSFPLLLFSFF